jgi:demethylmenaquinone methyltransferase/2-methoxy-6-polyprenyl-1,4-benzoquinol methylase
MTEPQTNYRARDVRRMFGRIARRYDLMNAVMTFGQDGRWRRRAARLALSSGGPGGRVALDIGAGTGDLARALAEAGAQRVVAADFSETMLLQAQRKLQAIESIDLAAADALRLPFADAVFDCVTNGFLLRNVADLGATLRELRRVLRPGGRLVCLEITHPPARVDPLFRPYFEGIVPLLGWIIAGDAAAYRYLPASVRPFPDPDGLAAMLREAGFVDVSYRRLNIGVVALHTGLKPP